MTYKLVDEKSGETVELPAKRKDFRGDSMTVVGFTPPHHDGSTGRIQVKSKGTGPFGAEYFPSVCGLKIVREED
jgi:hypothetical protein